MSRPWRIEYEGALYHLLSRGNEGRVIFKDDTDRRFFLYLVSELSERFDMDIYAYVLMENHYHLLAKTHKANLKKAMHWFGTTYTQRYNWRHSRSGHLFQGRYKSIIVQNDAYMLRLSCYIHRNPLRAGVVERLADYPWSSYHPYAYGNAVPDWLETKMILSQFGNKHKHRQYREKVQNYADEKKDLWEDLRYGILLGSHKFVERIKERHLPSKTDTSVPQQTRIAKTSDHDDLLHIAEKTLHVKVWDLKNAGRVYGEKKDKRDLMVFLLWKSGNISNKKIGRYFNITHSAVSHAVRSFQIRLQNNPDLKARYDELNSQFKL